MRWTGDSSGTVYSACYTSWGKSTDVVTKTTIVSGTPQYDVYAPFASAVDGIANGGPVYVSESSSSPQCIITLNNYTMVTSVNIVNVYPAWFVGISVYFGNSTTYSSNILIFNIGSPSQSHFDFQKTLTTPVFGKYLIIVSSQTGQLGIDEIQIHGYN